MVQAVATVAGSNLTWDNTLSDLQIAGLSVLLHISCMFLKSPMAQDVYSKDDSCLF